jgi:hypothetical protein
MSGTRRTSSRLSNTEPDFNRHPEKPTVIDPAWENWSLHDL